MFNANEYQKKEKSFTRAKTIGYFSLNSERFYTRDVSGMKYLSMPNKEIFPLDLNAASIYPVENENSETYLDNMLLYIRDHQETILKKYIDGRCAVDANIVTHCELLQVLLCTIYTKRDWKIFGTKYRNTIYLHLEITSEESKVQRDCNTWDSKLKRFLYSDKNQILELKPKDEELYCVFQSYIDNLSVIYDSPMGAYNGNLKNDISSKFVECLVIPPEPIIHDIGISESELTLSLWSKCALRNIQQIYVARPNTSGHIKAIESKPLHSLIHENKNNWQIEKCKDFLINTLKQIRQIMILDNPKAVYQFNYDSNSEEIKFEVWNQVNEHTFISDWFCTMLK